MVTAVSALISLGFSAVEVRRSAGHTRTVALYVVARSVALAIGAVSSLIIASPPWLTGIATMMILVQVCDACIGVRIGDRMKTYGPAGTAALNALALLWLSR